MKIKALMLGWMRVFAVAIGIVAVAAPVQSPAQSGSQSERTRRLREHEKKIQEIINQRRAEREKRAAEAGPQQQPETAQPAEVEIKPEETPKPASSVVMGFKFINEQGISDYNLVVREGETFVSEVMLFNIDQNPIDRIRLSLRYDKRFITPEKIFDTALKPYIQGDPVFTVNQRDSLLNYDAKLKRPLDAPQMALLKVLWKADRQTAFTGLDFQFSALEKDDDEHTAIYVRNENILGTRDDAMDGVLSGGLMIEGPKNAKKVMQGKEEELKQIYLGDVANDSKVGLVLTKPGSGAIQVGDEFVVKVKLDNPSGAQVDALNFTILFDPKVLRVVDKDKFNYITTGINVHDGPYHYNFPWDMHIENDVRNESGLVSYAMALANGGTLESRTIADVHFKAIGPAERTDVGFVRSRPGAPDLTSVRYFGYEILDLRSAYLSRSTISFPVLNKTVEVASDATNGGLPIPTPAPTPTPKPENSVKPLKIERQ
ncbi:hypothetical protein IT570_02180 [Candidatus Sumerlaeota bacterium]|nr:hypothetical protein [Candidatus Sumerlaeota bacterium]